MERKLVGRGPPQHASDWPRDRQKAPSSESEPAPEETGAQTRKRDEESWITFVLVRRERNMPKQPVPPRPGEPPQPQPPGPDMPPINELPGRPDLEPIDPPQGDPAPSPASVRPSARQERPARRPDRYDMIGAAS